MTQRHDEVILALANCARDSFHYRHQVAGLSIEKAARIDAAWATPEILAKARQLIVADILQEYGPEVAARWNKELAKIWP